MAASVRILKSLSELGVRKLVLHCDYFIAGFIQDLTNMFLA